MRTFLTGAAIIGLFIGVPVFDATGSSGCRYEYDISINGLYVVKERVCRGRLGFVTRETVERRPRFIEF